MSNVPSHILAALWGSLISAVHFPVASVLLCIFSFSPMFLRIGFFLVMLEFGVFVIVVAVVVLVAELGLGVVIYSLEWEILEWRLVVRDFFGEFENL